MPALQVITVPIAAWPPPSADDVITLAIERWLARIAGPGLRFIDVEVRDGVVTLTGIVGSRRARARIHAMARQVPGARGLRDRLQVRGIRRHRVLDLPAGRSANDARKFPKP